MDGETLLQLLDVLDRLAQGYKECAQKIFSAESGNTVSVFVT